MRVHAASGCRKASPAEEAMIGEIAKKIQEQIDRACGEPSAVPMPQKIHGRETYPCWRERGHVGRHGFRLGDEVVEWGEP